MPSPLCGLGKAPGVCRDHTDAVERAPAELAGGAWPELAVEADHEKDCLASGGPGGEVLPLEASLIARQARRTLLEPQASSTRRAAAQRQAPGENWDALSARLWRFARLQLPPPPLRSK